MKNTVAGLAVLLAGAAFAAPPQHGSRGESGREAFIVNQAYESVQRVSGQVDILEANQNALAERVARLESGGGEVAAIKAEIDALRSDISRLRSEMRSQRQEIVDDLLKRIKASERSRPRTPPPAPAPASQGTYTVQAGDTLSLIAQAFGTTVSRIKEMNNLKSDMLRVGQKLTVPERR
ncbi:MAG: LysM peptidoglycan-binding domain-containing protein [Kiritimatiellae bacterium]|nr:LysM peptidoglycan-binding domain-containing protein [Kiritimatiellia bacterium]